MFQALPVLEPSPGPEGVPGRPATAINWGQWSAVGMSSLPFGITVEIEAILEVS